MLKLKHLTTGAAIATLCAGPVSAACPTAHGGRSFPQAFGGSASWRDQGVGYAGSYGPTNVYNTTTSLVHETQLNVVTTVIGNSATVYGGSQPVTVTQTSQPIFVGGGGGYGSGYGTAPGTPPGGAGNGWPPGGGPVGVGGGNTILPIGTGTTGGGNTILPINTGTTGNGNTILPVSTGATGNGNTVLPVNTGGSVATGAIGSPTAGNGTLNGNSVPVSVGGVAVGTGATTAPTTTLGAPVISPSGAAGLTGAAANLGLGQQTNEQGGSAVQLCSGCASQLTGGVGG